MEKAKKKDKTTDEVTQIYELIKGKDFIQDLWLDALSDINKKPSYARLKSMVSKVINSETENYAFKPENDEERLKTRTIFSRLSIMTYTIDTLISEILYKKLNGEIKSIIVNILNDLRDKSEKTVKSEEQNDSVDMLEDIGEILCNGDTEDHQNPINEGKSKLMFITEDQKSKNRHKRNRVSDDENSDVDIMNASDDESNDENSSSRSIVSSVHTSDLSSFEDTISISSEDEDGFKIKKHVPLKLAKDLCAAGKISELHERRKKKTKTSSPKCSSSPKKLDDSSTKRLPTRMRKLNSKYSSDDVICPIKPILSQGEIPRNAIKIEEYEMEDTEPKISPIKKRRPTRIPYDVERVNKILGISPRRAMTSIKEVITPKNLNNQGNQGKSVQISQPTRNIPNGFPDNNTASSSVVMIKPIIIERRKRGRPTKKPEPEISDSEHSPVKIEKKSDDEISVSEVKRKRGRPSKIAKIDVLKTSSQNTSEDKNTDDINTAQMKHSVESFSILEEQLCLKDKKKSPEYSPSKSSTKSYDKSDLYKPHSDFRLSLKSRGSKALTLFSN